MLLWVQQAQKKNTPMPFQYVVKHNKFVKQQWRVPELLTIVPLRNIVLMCPCTMVPTHLEDKVVFEHKVGDAGHKNEDGWEDSSPKENDPIGLRQLHQVGDLEASDVINGKES